MGDSMNVDMYKALFRARLYQSAAEFGTSETMYKICCLAIEDIGKKEEGVNDGPYIRAMREYCGFPVKRNGPWCSVFASAKTREAYSGNDGMPELSRGAFRFVKNVANSKFGRYMESPEPGFAVWKRKGWLLHRNAHIRIIVAYDLPRDTMYCVAGNENNMTSPVILRNGSWRKKLLRMATIGGR